MSRLLYADMSRMKKSMAFKLAIFCAVVFGIFICYGSYRDMVKYDSEIGYLNLCFYSMDMAGFLIAVFTSMYVGTEYSDGTIRNKILVGHKRRNIYLASFLSCTAANFMMLAGYLIIVSCIGIPLFGFPSYSGDVYGAMGVYVLDGLLLLIAYAAVFNLIALLNSSKAQSAVISLLLTIAMFIIVTYLANKLYASEIYVEAVAEAGEAAKEIMSRPEYMTGTERRLCQFIIDFLPVGQGLRIGSLKAPNPWYLAIYSVIITIGFNVAGIYFFKKKNLK